MAHNDPSAYGLTISCWDDADALLSTVDGVKGVAEDAYHRITNRTILDAVNPEAGADWGEDVTTWLGMDPAMLARRGPILSEVLTRDERIDTADVRIGVTPVSVQGKTYAATFEIVCTTALGPFRRVFALSTTGLDDITNLLTGDAA